MFDCASPANGMGSVVVVERKLTRMIGPILDRTPNRFWPSPTLRYRISTASDAEMPSSSRNGRGRPPLIDASVAEPLPCDSPDASSRKIGRPTSGNVLDCWCSDSKIRPLTFAATAGMDLEYGVGRKMRLMRDTDVDAVEASA